MKLSKTYIPFLAVAVLMSSCASFRQFKEARANTQEERRIRKEEYAKKIEEENKEVHLVTKAALEAAPVLAPQLVQDSLLLSYERTPCFGRCPVFKIKVFQGGYVTYNGVNFVEYMGTYHSRVDESTLSKIYALISDADFFSLDDEYNNENVSDLPSKIFRVNAMGHDKRIIARYNFPESLKTLSAEIEALFEGTPWKAMENGH